MENLLNLDGKVALITGASRGIGYATLKLFAAHQCTVIGTATSQQGADQISQHLQSMGKQGEGLVMNLQNRDSIYQISEHLANTYQTVDILVNNAGITKDSLMIRLKPDQWDDVINTNLSGVFFISQKIIHIMLKRKTAGKIINISSISGLAGNPGQVNYSASKGGLVAMTKTIARELAGRNITANCIAPGFTETEMVDKLSEELKSELINNQIPLKRLAKPEEIAGSILFLASSLSSYITGETINVSGGTYI